MLAALAAAAATGMRQTNAVWAAFSLFVRITCAASTADAPYAAWQPSVCLKSMSNVHSMTHVSCVSSRSRSRRSAASVACSLGDPSGSMLLRFCNELLRCVLCLHTAT
jgi:hypothetical protein